MIKEEYKQWIVELKGKIRSAQVKAALSVNQALILLYWDLGKTIAQKENVWGSKLLENISSDLKAEFPDAGGFSVTNLKYCKLFYNYFSIRPQLGDEIDFDSLLIGSQAVNQIQNTKNQLDIIRPQVGDEFRQQAVDQLVQQVVAQIPWGHIKLIITKVKDLKAAFFYIQQTKEKGWSRDWLLNAIKMDSYSHAQKQIQSHNFNETLPVIHSDYANEVFKDALDSTNKCNF